MSNVKFIVQIYVDDMVLEFLLIYLVQFLTYSNL